MMVLVNAYSSILTSYLAVHKLTPIVNTVQELAARSSETEVTVHYGTEQTRMFLVDFVTQCHYLSLVVNDH